MCPLLCCTQNIHKSCQTDQILRIKDVHNDSAYKDVDSSDDGKELIIMRMVRIRLNSNLR